MSIRGVTPRKPAIRSPWRYSDAWRSRPCRSSHDAGLLAGQRRKWRVTDLHRENVARPGRFELPTPRSVVWCSVQLSYGRRRCGRKGGVARPKGFEPLTPRFVVWCSIQLSYGRPCRHRGEARGNSGGSDAVQPLLSVESARDAHSTRKGGNENGHPCARHGCPLLFSPVKRRVRRRACPARAPRPHPSRSCRRAPCQAA